LLTKFRATYEDFPRTFWTLVGSTFIDRLGGSLIFPFLSIYITNRFKVGLTEVGLLLGVWSISGLAGSMVGGAMTDKFGRRFMLIFGLIFSAGTALLLGFANDLKTFFWVLAFTGFLSDIGGPAQGAMVADLLPEKKRSEGFGILRVSANLAGVFGPAIGGMLAGVSYLLLFIIDACASLITAAIVFYALPETKPAHTADHPSEGMLKTFRGYAKVARDKLFMAFILVSITMIFVYTQMYSTLSVFLNQIHHVPPQGFGLIMSLNTLMVVLLQFWITSKIKKFEPMLVLMAATLLYGIGFTMYGFVSVFPLFLLAMAIITIGEMLHVPVAQSLAARFAPADMRGRYMAVNGLSWAIPHVFGTLAAGLVMDNFNPNLIWYLAGGISVIAALGFLFLHIKARDRFRAAPPVDEENMESVEGHLNL
jgi:MFS family permease